MSKKQESGLAVSEPQGTTALAGPSPYARSFNIEGERAELLRMPFVHLHQGTISEKEYGDFPKGSLIHSGSKTVMASDQFILLSGGWMEYSRADDNGRWIYKTRDRNEVPPADLVWNGDEPPAALMTWFAPALFVGEEMPVAIAIKINSKVKQTAYSTVVQAEKARAAMRRSPLLWKYGNTPQENKQGKWIVPKFTSAGDPPAELLKRASLWFEAASTATVAEPHAQDTGDYDPDAH